MVIAILGCSGSGKTTLTNKLINTYGHYCPKHVTTREPRKDDNGFYEYVSKEMFLSMQKEGEFWIASGDGKRYYGIKRHDVMKYINQNN